MIWDDGPFLQGREPSLNYFANQDGRTTFAEPEKRWMEIAGKGSAVEAVDANKEQQYSWTPFHVLIYARAQGAP
jgi:hypothetical protein